MKSMIAVAVLTVIAASSCTVGSVEVDQLNTLDQALTCQGTLLQCVEACTPPNPPPDCRRQYKECLKAHPSDKKRCREEAAVCQAERREARDALRDCLKNCREDFRQCEPGGHHCRCHCHCPGGTNCHCHCHGDCDQACDNCLDPNEVAACMNTANNCMDSCQVQANQCVETATAQVQAWLDSIGDLFEFCVAQSGGDFQMLIECLGDLPEINISCFEASAACFRTCSGALGTCLSNAKGS